MANKKILVKISMDEIREMLNKYYADKFPGITVADVKIEYESGDYFHDGSYNMVVDTTETIRNPLFVNKEILNKDREIFSETDFKKVVKHWLGEGTKDKIGTMYLHTNIEFTEGSEKKEPGAVVEFIKEAVQEKAGSHGDGRNDKGME